MSSTPLTHPNPDRYPGERGEVDRALYAAGHQPWRDDLEVRAAGYIVEGDNGEFEVAYLPLRQGGVVDELLLRRYADDLAAAGWTTKVVDDPHLGGSVDVRRDPAAQPDTAAAREAGGRR